MATDWTAIGREYVNGRATYAQLARKYGVSTVAVASRGKREDWVARRRARLRSGVPDTAPAVDSQALRAKLLALADNWTDSQAGQIQDVGDYRRVVQSVLDLTRAAGDDAAPAVHVVMDVPQEYGE